MVEIAVSMPDTFSTLVAAVQTANLVDTLSSAGPFTVFAPTNAAFAALPAGTLDTLLANPDQLSAILTYHVVAGSVVAADLRNGQVLTTVNGATLTVRIIDSTALILNNDGTIAATVAQADVIASNGIIHVIDAVLIPAADVVDTTTAATDSTVTPSTSEPSPTPAPSASTTTATPSASPAAATSVGGASTTAAPMEPGSITPTSDDSSRDSGDVTSGQPAVLPTASPTPAGVDDPIDATSGSSGGRDGDAGMSGGVVAGIVVVMLLALVLAIAAVMWVRGTPIPYTEKHNPHGNDKAVANPMYSNPTYVGGADRAAPGRRDLEVSMVWSSFESSSSL